MEWLGRAGQTARTVTILSRILIVRSRRAHVSEGRGAAQTSGIAGRSPSRNRAGVLDESDADRRPARTDKTILKTEDIRNARAPHVKRAQKFQLSQKIIDRNHGFSRS
jgi:hypothetical protein